MIQIIPAIDLYQGQVVRLTHGDYNKVKVYFKDPVDAAKRFAALGLTKIHMVDLEGARDRKRVNWKALEAVTKATQVEVEYSGGISDDESLKNTFSAGAAQVTLGTAAFKQREMVQNWLKTYGPEKIIIGADCKNGNLAISGWEEEVKIGLSEYIQQWVSDGAEEFLVTSVAKDGAMLGPDFELYASLLKQFSAKAITASGGVSKIEDVEKLNDMNLERVIVGKAILENEITAIDLKLFLC